MNGDFKVDDATSQLHSTDHNERPEESAAERLAVGFAPPTKLGVGQTGKCRRRTARRGPTANSLSVKSHSGCKDAPTEGISSTDSESSSLFTTTSDITSDDDAASIESRLRQLVVEQQEKLELDDRYRSTPVLAHRFQTEDKHQQLTADRDARYADGSDEGGGQVGPKCLPSNVRAKSTNDIWTFAAKVGRDDIFNCEQSAEVDNQVPDVFVIRVDEEQSQAKELAPDDDQLCIGTGTSSETKQRSGVSADSSGQDPLPSRARSVSIASGQLAARREMEGGRKEDVSKSSMRRNISSSLLPERGNLRNLNTNRGSGIVTNELALVGRTRSNTAGSVDKSALFSIGFAGNALANADESMLSIRRSAWTLSDFDQTFNKSAMMEQQKVGEFAGLADKQQKMQQYSTVSDAPRGSSGSDRQSSSLLIKASKNAMAGLSQIQSLDTQSPPLTSERCSSIAKNSDRRPSFSHSILSIPSSVDSYSSSSKPSPYERKQRKLLAANTRPDDDKKRSCPGSCLNMETMSRYLPILDWLPNYKLETFYSDLIAGLTVTALNISTSLSAAVVAETDFGAAFRASIVNTFVYAILCSSKHASFGSWSIMSQMLLLSVKRALNDEIILDQLNMGPSASWEPEEYEKWHMNIIVMYTFLIGLVQLICGTLGLGNILSSFIPEALCSSMIAATAFTMAIGQLANMCGTTNKILWQIERNTTELWADLKNPPVDITDLFANTFRWIQQIILLFKHHDRINAACVIISVVSVILLYLNQYVIQQQLQRLLNRKILIPFEMVLLIAIIIVSYSLNLAENYNVATCGPISIDFGIPNLPNLRLIRELWYNSLATALISYTMVYIMAKSYSNKFNYEVNYNQELIACGAGNLIGGLFDALPATASFSRTAAQVEAGGQTQMVSIINCVLLVVLARLLGTYVSALPICVMSAALFFGFSRMMTRFTDVFMYWRICKVDCAIWVVTFVAILAVDMVNGFIFGFIFSILTMLYRAQNRRCYMLGTIGSSDVYVPLVKYPFAQEMEGIKIFQFCGPIHYVCADLVERLLRQKTRVNVKEVSRYISEQGIDKFNPRDLNLPTHIILDFSMISFIDSAGIHVIKKIIEDYQKINVTILLASLASHVAAVVKNEPSLWNVYKERFYITLADAVHCATRDRFRRTGASVRADA